MLSDLILALDNLLRKRTNILLSCNSGRLYEPILQKCMTDLSNLPEELTLPLTYELKITDGTHDDLGGSIYHFCRAYELNPTVGALSLIAKKIRDLYVPRLGELRKSYPDEAAKALENSRALEEMEEDLNKFPVGEGKTLYNWVSDFLDAGKELGRLLNQRAKIKANTKIDNQMKQHAGGVRSSVIGTLNRFRATLKDEIAISTELQEDLDSRLFSFFDELNSLREIKYVPTKQTKNTSTPPEDSSTS